MDEFIYLASFPRSGNTWVRFLLANLYKNIEKDTIEIDFHNIHDIIPELNIKNPGQNFSYANLPKICKTHSSYLYKFNKVILIIRNPFDVFLSYYDFLINNRKLSLSLKEVILHNKFGIMNLINHTNSYLYNCSELLIIYYEMLKQNTTNELNKICDFIKLNATDIQIKMAIEHSSFLNMKKIETEKGRKFGNPDFIFIRKGEYGLGEEIIKKDKDVYEYMRSCIKNCEIFREMYLN